MLPLPQLFNMLDTKSTTRSIMFPRFPSRSTLPTTPPSTSSTMPQSLELPSPASSQLLLQLLLLPQSLLP